MAQRSRFDEPGAWLHIMNRGIARRTLFETRADFRYFQACLARAVRAGWFEVHAYCLLMTHFHLLIRSTRGEAWRGLRHLENAYSRRFNLRRKRDGPLFRGRFRSKRVTDELYWRTVVRYIDQNAPAAGLAPDSQSWPFGSAVHYRSDAGPPWLARGVVEAVAAGDRPYSADAYRQTFGDPLTEAQRRLVDVRLDSPARGEDPFDDLVGAAPQRVASWMRQKAALADGTSPGDAVVAPGTLVAALARRRAELDESADGASPRQNSDWRAVQVALLRLACGVTYNEIGMRLGCSTATAHGRMRAFGQMAAVSHPLFAVAAATLHDAIRADWGDVRHCAATDDVIGLTGRRAEGRTTPGEDVHRSR